MHDAEADIYRKNFLAVVDELRAALGYALRDCDPEPGEELAMEMMYGNFDFSVVHSHNFRPDKVLLECDFGEVPEGRRGAILEKLLQMNTVLAELDGSVFCLSQDSSRLIYTLPMRLSTMDGHQLLSKMTEIVWHGRRWLETRFLNDKNEERGQLLNPVHLA